MGTHVLAPPEQADVEVEREAGYGQPRAQLHHPHHLGAPPENRSRRGLGPAGGDHSGGRRKRKGVSE